jgi:Leucine-rich repeat (LRR) protein
MLQDHLKRVLADAAASGSDHFGLNGDRWWYRGASGQIAGLRELTILPPDIALLVDVEQIVVCDSAIAMLPPDVGRLRSLKTLNISNTKLTALPDEMSGLERLTTLSLSRNHLSRLPDAIGYLTQLATILVADNHLQELPQALARLTRLQSLDASNNEIDALPALNSAALRSLILHHNRVRQLPDFGALPNLSWLSLEHNDIEMLPVSIGELRSLRTLDASHNRLATLPIEFARLTQLSSLGLSHNQLLEWPAAFCEFPNLHRLNLEGNPITELPPQITQLPSIRELRLYAGQPTPLPIDRHLKYWDVFISHASEDTASVAAPLAEILVRSGLRVWLDQQDLRLGDSLRGKLDEGLSRSRFGVVILSAAFLRKSWTQQELGGLMSLEEQGTNVILPVWHQLTKAELARRSPLLADRVAVDTALGLPAVASRIVDVVLYRRPDSPPTLFPSLTQRFARLIAANDTEAIADFLVLHPVIVNSALGSLLSAGNRIVRTPNPVTDTAMVMAIIRRGTSQSLDQFNLVLETSGGPLVTENGELVPDLQQSLDRTRRLVRDLRSLSQAETLFEEAIIVRSRRFDLSDRDRRWLRENEQTLRAEGIQVRSYDWLLDASVVTMNLGGV